MATTEVLTGLDLLVREDFRRIGKARVGLLVNPASVDRRLRHCVPLFAEAGVKLSALFGPQHGIDATTQDNMVEWQGFLHPRLGIPVYSLYGEVRRPTPEMLQDLELMVLDLPDVGARYYTFLWTATLVMEACARAGIPVMVLDRPNPIGGRHLEGPGLEREYASFVGRFPLLIRHGMSMGELLEMINRTEGLGCELSVVPVLGWEGRGWFEATGLPWVMPSPNMPTPDTALVYPGFCLLEGTTLSEGRGTTRPFELLGAPFIDGETLATALAQEKLPGAAFRPCAFLPTFQKYAGRPCGGIQVHVQDRDAFRPVRTAVAVLSAIRRLWPDHPFWRDPPYEYEEVKLPFDILSGSPRLRLQIEAGVPLVEIVEGWRSDLADFVDRRRPFLRYGQAGVSGSVAGAKP